MSLKCRRFSLDSSVCLDGSGSGVIGTRRGSGKFSSKKSRHSNSLEDAQLERQELNHSLNSSMAIREPTIAEESLERLHELTNNNSFLKRNKIFHKLFQEIPEGEKLSQTFICALQKEVLYHGKLFVSENHVCFHSSVLLKETKVVILSSSVREVKKHNSALSMLTIQTADGEKYSFVSLRNRDMCYKLLQSVCSHAQRESQNSSPRLSFSENEDDRDVISSYSSLDDSIDCNLSRQNSIHLENGLSQMYTEGPTTFSFTRQSSLTDEDDRAVSWIWRVVQRVAPFFFLREIRNLSFLFHIYMILLVLLLLVSGYIGLRIIALEDRLNSLGALTETFVNHHGEYEEM